MKRGKIMSLGLVVLAVALVRTAQAAWSQVIRIGNEYRVLRYKTGLEEHFRQPND